MPPPPLIYFWRRPWSQQVQLFSTTKAAHSWTVQAAVVVLFISNRPFQILQTLCCWTKCLSKSAGRLPDHTCLHQTDQFEAGAGAGPSLQVSSQRCKMLNATSEFTSLTYRNSILTLSLPISLVYNKCCKGYINAFFIFSYCNLCMLCWLVFLSTWFVSRR